MYIKASFTTRWYWQVAWICNFAKLLGAKTTYYSAGTGSDYAGRMSIGGKGNEHAE